MFDVQKELLGAAKNGNVQLAIRLLEENVDVNGTDKVSNIGQFHFLWMGDVLS